MPPTLRRTTSLSSCTLLDTSKRPHNSLTSRSFSTTKPHNATLLRRPKRPYTFTQLITLSDGSTYTHRTTSPLAVYKSAKDIRNTPMWNPSNMRIANVEIDEAGRLRAFRKRFGRGWDAQEDPDAIQKAEERRREVEEKTGVVDGMGARLDGEESRAGMGVGEDKDKVEGEKREQVKEKRQDENLMDLIGSFSTDKEKLGAIGSGGDYRTGKGGKKGGKK